MMADQHFDTLKLKMNISKMKDGQLHLGTSAGHGLRNVLVL
jgi:hypothetical protein